MLPPLPPSAVVAAGFAGAAPALGSGGGGHGVGLGVRLRSSALRQDGVWALLSTLAICDCHVCQLAQAGYPPCSVWLSASSLFGAEKPFFVPSPATWFPERAEGVPGTETLA